MTTVSAEHSGPYVLWTVAPDNQPATTHGEAIDMPSADEPTTTAPEPGTTPLRLVLTPMPVERLDYRATQPGCIFDATIRTSEEIALFTVRYAIGCGCPPEEFGTEPTQSGTDVNTADTTTFGELFGQNSDWWEYTTGTGLLWLTENARALDMPELLYGAEITALDWLNGMGLTDVPGPEDVVIQTRCHPDYATTHSYLHDNDGLWLLGNDVIGEEY